MSARVTRKRSRVEEGGQDLPPMKREPDRGGSEGTDGVAGNDVQADGQAKDGRVLKQDEEFWFEDGTVILVARDVEFRVYRGVLTGLSSVFKDLFAQPHLRRDVVLDGVPAFPCPVVDVSDSPEDLRHLLRACFSKKLGRLYERTPSYHEISSAIRLGHKYKVTELYSQALAFLKHYFPTSLDVWDDLENFVPPDWEASDVVGVVNLARFTGELSILPSAFITCLYCQSAFSGIARGIVREDGSQERLSPDDLLICLEGRGQLQTASITAILQTFKDTVSRKCKTTAACKKALQNVLLNLTEEDVDTLVNDHPFPKYLDFVGDGGIGTCRSCTKMVKERCKKEQNAVWESLPELFDLDIPGWKELPQPPHPSNE